MRAAHSNRMTLPTGRRNGAGASMEYRIAGHSILVIPVQTTPVEYIISTQQPATPENPGG